MVDKILISLISPLGSALLGGLVALVFFCWGKRKLGLFFAFLSLFWLYVWSTPLASGLIVDLLESQYPPVNIEDIGAADAAVVLGGGVFATSLGGNSLQQADLGNAADRVWYASRLYHAGKVKLLVFTGGRPRQYSGLSEAEAMQIFAMDLGIPQAHILLESGSQNTRENARFTRRLIEEKDLGRILLVTSAAHMGRAVKHFEAMGIKVLPAPTDFEGARLSGQYCCIPSAAALDVSGKVFKEVIGQLVL
ncbi:MAG: YdcF family protein [Halioglobus sp.]